MSFKASTEENNEVIRIIRDELCSYLSDHILDIGAGTGDIALGAFPEHTATLIDRLDFSEHPLSKNHTRLQADFFDAYSKFEDFEGTLLYSHVFQYLDDQYDGLITATQCINPDTIFTVTNDNDGFMGALAEWAHNSIPGSNPEVLLPQFPAVCGYSPVAQRRFCAHATADNWSVLTILASYLVEAPNVAHLSKIEDFLKKHLTAPQFEISQSVIVYKKERAS